MRPLIRRGVVRLGGAVSSLLISLTAPPTAGAEELTLAITANYAKGSDAVIAQVLNLGVNVDGAARLDQVVDVATNDTAIALGQVTSPGYVFLRNLSAAHSITVGPTNGTYFVRLKPGEPALFRLGATALHALAETTNANLRVLLFSD